MTIQLHVVNCTSSTSTTTANTTTANHYENRDATKIRTEGREDSRGKPQVCLNVFNLLFTHSQMFIGISGVYEPKKKPKPRYELWFGLFFGFVDAGNPYKHLRVSK